MLRLTNTQVGELTFDFFCTCPSSSVEPLHNDDSTSIAKLDPLTHKGAFNYFRVPLK